MLPGEWLGHAIHPPLTDVVLGTWTSATVLDIFGGRASAAAARRHRPPRSRRCRLDRVGRVVGGGLREQRVGLVHAVANVVAISTYAASWIARTKGPRGTGLLLALAWAGRRARKASRHPAHDGASSQHRAETASGQARSGSSSSKPGRG